MSKPSLSARPLSAVEVVEAGVYTISDFFGGALKNVLILPSSDRLVFGCYLFLKKKKDIRLRWALGFDGSMALGWMDTAAICSIL